MPRLNRTSRAAPAAIAAASACATSASASARSRRKPRTCPVIRSRQDGHRTVRLPVQREGPARSGQRDARQRVGPSGTHRQREDKPSGGAVGRFRHGEAEREQLAPAGVQPGDLVGPCGVRPHGWGVHHERRLQERNARLVHPAPQKEGGHGSGGGRCSVVDFVAQAVAGVPW